MSKTTTRDLTSGKLLNQLILFALPLFLGNVFQMLYNMVDTIVVGNFVGKEALAAVGSTTMITNMAVFFFNGLSIGAGVVISREFGAKDLKELHKSIETTMAMTLILCVLFTVFGVIFVKPMLRMMATPDDVMPDATIYLRTYIAGISGLMIYNMASGILRAVGDTTRPLYFLILTSIMNIVLDLLFVIQFKMGVMGVALATIIAQFASAVMVLRLLTKTNDIYKLTWNDLGIDKKIMIQILRIGLPASIQSTVTAFSNAFVQSYINKFGSAVMAGWSCYNKLDQFIFLPIMSMSNAATTIVSQNIGAKKIKRAEDAIFTTVVFTFSVCAVIAILLFLFAEPANGIFSKDSDVIHYGVLFIRTNIFFFLANSINHTMAGGIRGHGDSAGPMVILLTCFVAIRQIYLYVVTHFFANTPVTVALSYPVGWLTCCVTMLCYYNFVVKRRSRDIVSQ